MTRKDNTTRAKFKARGAHKPPVHTEISHGNKGVPVSISGYTIYIAWLKNNTVTNINDEEIMFRVSTDRGRTFDDKINLSITTDSNSTRVKINSDTNNIVVT